MEATHGPLTHALATDDIRKPTEEQLTNQSTDGSSHLDTKILVGVEFLRARVTLNIINIQ